MQDDIEPPDESAFATVDVGSLSKKCDECLAAANTKYYECRKFYDQQYCQIQYEANRHACKVGPCIGEI